MTNKSKHSGCPKTDKGKAISSRNSTTHGLTARRWINTNEQSLFDELYEMISSWSLAIDQDSDYILRSFK